MLFLKKGGCLALLLFTAACTYAQKPAEFISLNTLLNKVNQTAPSLITDSAAVLLRQAEAAETRNNWLPNLRLNYQADMGTNNNVAGPYFGFGVVPSNSRGVRSDNNASTSLADLGIAALDWEIYNFGAYGAEHHVASSNVDVQKNQFALSKFELQALTINRYLQLLRYANLLKIQEANIKRNEDITRSIRSLAKSGVRAGVDTSIAEAELSKSRLNYIELSNQMKQVQLQLSLASGLPYLSIVPDPSAQEILLRQTGQAVLLPADSASHPIVGYYRSVYQNSLQKETMIKKRYNPKISLEAAVWGRGSSITAADEFRNLAAGWGFERSNYLVGLGISYNLFDIRRRQLKVRTQKAVSGYDLKKLKEEQAQLSLSSSQADHELATALQRLQEIPNQLKAANSGYRQKFSLYKNGLTDVIELNAALNILYRAETDEVLAKDAYCRALFQKAITSNQVGHILNLLNQN